MEHSNAGSDASEVAAGKLSSVAQQPAGPNPGNGSTTVTFQGWEPARQQSSKSGASPLFGASPFSPEAGSSRSDAQPSGTFQFPPCSGRTPFAMFSQNGPPSSEPTSAPLLKGEGNPAAPTPFGAGVSSSSPSLAMSGLNSFPSTSGFGASTSPPTSGSNPSPVFPSFGGAAPIFGGSTEATGGSAPAFGCSTGAAGGSARAQAFGCSIGATGGSAPAFGCSTGAAGGSARAQAFGCSIGATGGSAPAFGCPTGAEGGSAPVFGCSTGATGGSAPAFGCSCGGTRSPAFGRIPPWPSAVPSGFSCTINGFNQGQWVVPGCSQSWNNPLPWNAKRCYCGKVAGLRFTSTPDGFGLFYCCPDYNEEAIRNGTQDRNYCTYKEGPNSLSCVRRCYCGKVAVLQKSEKFGTRDRLFYSCPEYREKDVMFGRCSRVHCSYIDWDSPPSTS